MRNIGVLDSLMIEAKRGEEVHLILINMMEKVESPFSRVWTSYRGTGTCQHVAVGEGCCVTNSSVCSTYSIFVSLKGRRV